MKIHHHTPRRLTALFLVMAVMLSLVPSAFAAQQDSYADLWGPLSELLKKLTQVVEM